MNTLSQLLPRLIQGERLTRQESRDMLVQINTGTVPDAQVAAALTALKTRGITVDELLGLRDGILLTGVPVHIKADRFVDIVGTGGDGKNTFNISTCACLVVAGAGYKVVKHGNYAATSVSGASNVIEGHGVRFTADEDQHNRNLDACNFTYLHAPLFARAMKAVAPVRKALPFATAFNLLGPLVNPSQPGFQLLGVANLEQMRLYSQVFSRLGVSYGIVNSLDGYDEISLTGPFKVTTCSVERLYSPADLGLPVAQPQHLRGGDTPQEAVRLFDSVLQGTALPDQKNVVLANAAYAIGTLEPTMSPLDTVALARESLESGKALQVLNKFVELNAQ